MHAKNCVIEKELENSRKLSEVDSEEKRRKCQEMYCKKKDQGLVKSTKECNVRERGRTGEFLQQSTEEERIIS